jgi:flagellar FliJ protein
MNRAQRMAPVQRVLGDAERDRARELSDAQRRLADAEARLVELRTYQVEYLGVFRQRAGSGQSVLALRDFQAFLARLDEALRQQESLVATAREQAAGSRRSWQGAARQVKAVESVVDRWQAAETRTGERREQKETDERAQRTASRSVNNPEAQ